MATLLSCRSHSSAARPIARGRMTKSRWYALRRLFPDVNVDPDIELTAAIARRRGGCGPKSWRRVAGFSAAALHGSEWVEHTRAVELIHDNPAHACRESSTRGDRLVEATKSTMVGTIPVTVPARTALDLGCWYPTTRAVAGSDALARATEIKAADVELLDSVDTAGGAASPEHAKRWHLVDAGAQSPKESWLRVVLIQAGLPRPQTQIPSSIEFGNAIAISTWAGKTSRSRSSTTASNIAPTVGNNLGRSVRLEMSNGWVGSSSGCVAGDRPDDIVRRVRSACWLVERETSSRSRPNVTARFTFGASDRS